MGTLLVRSRSASGLGGVFHQVERESKLGTHLQRLTATTLRYIFPIFPKSLRRKTRKEKKKENPEDRSVPFRVQVTDMCLKKGRTISTEASHIIEQVLWARLCVRYLMGPGFLTIAEWGSRRLLSCLVPTNSWLNARMKGTVGRTATVTSVATLTEICHTY